MVWQSVSNLRFNRSIGDEEVVQAGMEVELMKPEKRMEELWELGSWERRRIAGSEMRETGIFAVAACTAADGADLRGGEASGEPASEANGAEELSLGGTCLEVKCEASVGGGFLVNDQNVILCDTQSIDGLHWCNHKYPSTAMAEQSSGVNRN